MRFHPLILVCSLEIASAQVTVRGVVTGYDGKPMPAAEVQLANGANERVADAVVGADGAFELRAPRPGLFRLYFAGVLHGPKETLLFTDRPGTISLRAQLGAPTYVKDPNGPRLSTSEANSPLNNTPFLAQPDGTFAAEVASDAPELLLAVNGISIGGPPLPLPGAAEYRCLPNLHCYAVARPSNGKLRVTFDPKRLLRTSEPAWVRYDTPGSPVAVAGAALDRAAAFLLAMRDARRERALKLGKPAAEVAKDPPAPETVTAVVREIESERAALARHARFVEYLALVIAGAPSDRVLLRRIFDELTPSSPLWAFPYANIAGQAIAATGEPDKRMDYAAQIIDAQTGRGLKAYTALTIIDGLRVNGFASVAAPLIARTRAEFGDLPLVKSVLGDRIRPGRPVPPFHAPSFDDPAVEHSDRSLQGRVYLIDFWATWCAPCVAELPVLTKLYEQHKGQGFEVLSYSIDSNREVVRKFRKERFPMPWLHAIDPQFREIQSPMARNFEVLAIPRPVLVDRNGVIVATDQECRGSNLAELLKRLLPAH